MHKYYITKALQQRNQLVQDLKTTPVTPETESIIQKLLDVITTLQIEIENLFGERYG